MMQKTITLIPSILLDIEDFRFTSRRCFLVILPWDTISLLLAKTLK
jgi:hypothetical protein